VLSNRAGSGGGIWVQEASVQLISSVVEWNKAEVGAGIWTCKSKFTFTKSAVLYNEPENFHEQLECNDR